MKKILVTVFLAMVVAVSAIAQPKAIGLRGGFEGAEVSYQHSLTDLLFVEADFGADIIGGFGARGTAMVNYIFATPEWTSKGEWNWYAGAGLTTGWVYDGSMGFMAGVPVQAGLSYEFWFPLQISADVRPTVGLHAADKCGFYVNGLYGFIPTLSVHYCF